MFFFFRFEVEKVEIGIIVNVFSSPSSCSSVFLRSIFFGLVSFSLTFARLADDSLRLGLGGEQALDAVRSCSDLHRF